MNKTAEEILKEYYNHYKNVVFPEKNWVEWQDSHDYGSVEMIVAAMESYASSLSSEVERLRGELSEAQQADDWVRVEDGLPEIDTPVEVITKYENWASGKKVNQSDRFIGYMDEYGDLIICPTDDSYGWQFNDCVTKWRPLPSPPKQ